MSASTQNLVAVLSLLGSGRTLEKANTALTDIVQAVQSTGGKGTLTLTLNIGLNGEDSVAIVGTVKTKVPEAGPGKNIFFVTSDGRLVRTDPNEPEIPFVGSARERSGSAAGDQRITAQS